MIYLRDLLGCIRFSREFSRREYMIFLLKSIIISGIISIYSTDILITSLNIKEIFNTNSNHYVFGGAVLITFVLSSMARLKDAGYNRLTLFIPLLNIVLLTKKTKAKIYLKIEENIASIKGTKGMTVNEVIYGLYHGDKLIVYSYNISFLFGSVDKKSSAYLISNTYEKIHYSALHIFITLIFGWWSIPYGMIYSVKNIGENLFGGEDVTYVRLPYLEQLSKENNL